MTRRRPVPRVVAAALLLTACGTPAGGPRPGADGVTLTVLAAASLSGVLPGLGEAFAAEHPGTTVSFSFGPSTGLVQQALDGAPADVLATASTATMTTAVEGGAVQGEPVVFARNRLQLVVPAGNPGRVRGLADLARPGLKVALCAEQVPCGRAARQVLDSAGVRARPDTLEADVKAVLGKVTLGEVDAALVYRTDVLAAGDAVEGLDPAATAGAVTDYPIAVLAASPRAERARAFVDVVLGDDGAAALTAAGFERP